MSFCSYEEAWGSPFESNLKNEHVINSNTENDQITQVIPDNHSDEENTGFVETAPLNGSLLGGAIPKEQWKTNEVVINKIPSFEEKFDKKIDHLINTIEKYTKGYNNNNSDSYTNWTDVLIFISLGIFSILILDMFFRFGKYIVQSKIQNNNMTYETPKVHHMSPPQIPETPPLNNIPELPKYHYRSMMGGRHGYPYPKYSDFYRN